MATNFSEVEKKFWQNFGGNVPQGHTIKSIVFLGASLV